MHPKAAPIGIAEDHTALQNGNSSSGMFMTIFKVFSKMLVSETE